MYVRANPPQASSTMNVTRASNSAAAIEIAANRSPIGKPTIFLTQTARLLRSSARQASRARRLSDLGGAGGGVLSSSTAPSGTSGTGTGAPVGESLTCSSGGWRASAIAWCWACG